LIQPSYTCKTRHSRCDEKKPVCSNCERLDLECKPSDFIAPPAWRITTLGEASEAHASSEEPPQFDLEAPLSTWDIFRSRISGLDLLSDDSLSNNMIADLNLRSPPVPSLPPTKEPPVTLTSETAFLLQNYLRTVAKWMDLMDHSNTYEVHVARLTLSSPLLFHCVCAYTAKFLSLYNSRQNYTVWEPVASSHYGESLRLLINALDTPPYEHALTATILLSSYEIVSEIASEHHKRHLLGQMMLVKNHNINARSTGMDRANFWIHVRHEIGFALAMERPVMTSPEGWNVRWQEGDDREDVQGNHVLWILARVLSLIFGEESESATGTQKREGFLQELEDWRKRQLDTFIGIPYGEEDEDGFRKVFFTVTAAGTCTYSLSLVYFNPTDLPYFFQPPAPSGTMSLIFSYTPSPVSKMKRTSLSFNTKLNASAILRYRNSQILFVSSQVMGCTMRRSIFRV
jgi:hypothetical protein